MRKTTRFIYKAIIKRILFLFSADTIHTLFLRVGRFLGRYAFFRWIVKSMWRYDNTKLEQSIGDLYFRNPIGLSAGFDYNADLIDILPSVGFGFHTVGTLTFESYVGNPMPMLGRLPKSKSLLVNKGFKNEGVEKVLSNMSPLRESSMRGVSIGVTNKNYNSYEEMIENLISGFRTADKYDNFDYYELNISCPNLRNIKNLTEQLGSPVGLKNALEEISKLSITRPVFIKMPLERTREETDMLVDTVSSFPFIKGLIFSNLVKDRTNSAFDKKEIESAGTGNFSGKPVENQSNDHLVSSYKKYKDRFILIGTGGVFSAEDAYKKIRSGATLVELITGMVYEGPQLIGDINKGLMTLLERDGYTHISQAIGVDAK